MLILRNPVRRRTERRRGQALLMAVLIMVFAALLGATFVTVVALNLNQTARDEDRIVAAQNAKAGLRFVNDQLTNSAEGDNWRPTLLNIPPTPGDPTYNTYYTPFDQAQGWARTGAANERIFVKFPDPRSDNVSDNSPTYLVEVRKLETTTLPIDLPDNSSGNKTNDLRITVIGQTPNNPAVFSTTVNYKAGMGRRPLTRVARSVTNWNFSSNGVPEARMAADNDTNPLTLEIYNIKGSFPSAPFYITVGGPKPEGGTATQPRGGVVSSVQSIDLDGDGVTDDRRLTILSPLSPAPSVDERVELAAGIGAPIGVDFNASNAIDGNEQLIFKPSTNTTPGSVLVNGGLLWFGNLLLDNLRTDTASSPSSGVHTSGVMANMALNAGSTQVTVGGTTSSGASFSNGQLSTNSSDPNFPGAAGDWSTLSTAAKDELVSDGWNSLAGIHDPTQPVRETQAFIPPDITAGGNGFGRYRQLSKYSLPADSGDPATAALYGYGQGIYINNPDDKERVYDTTTNSLRSMTKSELQKLWFAYSTTNTVAADSYTLPRAPLAASSAAASLEQQHLRGWIAPDEFRARGALVEINSDNTITITLDARGDNTATDTARSVGPVPQKGWRDANGNLMGDNTSGGVYSRTIPWPANGVIFAEGNIRIRGVANNPPRSLTVVSMNNIYIEGSLGTGVANRKILLLPLKNGIVNPTAVLRRLEGQTRLRTASAVNASTISVFDAGSFRAGDWIDIGTATTTNPTVRRIASISGNNITVSPALTTDQAAITTVVRLKGDPNNESTSRPYIGDTTPQLRWAAHVLQRRFDLPTTATAVRLALRHGAERRSALSVKASLSAELLPVKADLANKVDPATPPAAPGNLVLSTLKQLSVVHDEGTDLFPQTTPLNPTFSITNLKDEMTAKRPPPTGLPLEPWGYTTAVTTGNDYGPLPFFYLTAVGYRYDFSGTGVGTFPRRKSIRDTTYEIPLATSVLFSVNGTTVPLQQDNGAGGFDAVNQLGLNPDLNGTEDILTSDQSFYTAARASGAGPTHLTLDNRRIQTGFGSGLNSIALRFHDSITGFFNASTRLLPPYGLSRLKFENDGQLNGSGEFETLTPGYTIDINAYVYAQEGSWFVLPGDHFDSRLKVAPAGGTYIDLDNDNTPEVPTVLVPTNNIEFLDSNGNGTCDPGEGPDLNRDGTLSRGEQVAAYRFRRYNYQINFTGSIMENHTAIVEAPTGSTVIGAVADWTDKWATVNINNANWTTGAFNASSLNSTNNFKSITYKFDDSAAIGLLEDDEGFHPPTTPELMYQG